MLGVGAGRPDSSKIDLFSHQARLFLRLLLDVVGRYLLVRDPMRPGVVLGEKVKVGFFKDFQKF